MAHDAPNPRPPARRPNLKPTKRERDGWVAVDRLLADFIDSFDATWEGDWRSDITTPPLGFDARPGPTQLSLTDHAHDEP